MGSFSSWSEACITLHLNLHPISSSRPILQAPVHRVLDVYPNKCMPNFATCLGLFTVLAPRYATLYKRGQVLNEQWAIAVPQQWFGQAGHLAALLPPPRALRSLVAEVAFLVLSALHSDWQALWHMKPAQLVVHRLSNEAPSRKTSPSPLPRPNQEYCKSKPRWHSWWQPPWLPSRTSPWDHPRRSASCQWSPPCQSFQGSSAQSSKHSAQLSAPTTAHVREDANEP